MARKTLKPPPKQSKRTATREASSSSPRARSEPDSSPPARSTRSNRAQEGTTAQAAQAPAAQAAQAQLHPIQERTTPSIRTRTSQDPPEDRSPPQAPFMQTPIDPSGQHARELTTLATSRSSHRTTRSRLNPKSSSNRSPNHPSTNGSSRSNNNLNPNNCSNGPTSSIQPVLLKDSQ